MLSNTIDIVTSGLVKFNPSCPLHLKSIVIFNRSSLLDMSLSYQRVNDSHLAPALLIFDNFHNQSVGICFYRKHI
jgi:hypothetical protein